MPCRSPGPHPGGKLRGLAFGGGLSKTTPGGGQVHTQGVCLQADTQGGGLQEHTLYWGRHPPPGRQLLLRAVRILLECILVFLQICCKNINLNYLRHWRKGPLGVKYKSALFLQLVWNHSILTYLPSYHLYIWSLTTKEIVFSRNNRQYCLETKWSNCNMQFWNELGISVRERNWWTLQTTIEWYNYLQ